MKNCILTPTFKGHFQYLKNYLHSFQTNVTDKDTCVIYFIINADENKDLQKIVKKYPDLDIQVLFFEDILKKYNILESPQELLKKYGKYSFQALKKFYGMLYLEQYRYFLVLDTESMWINSTNMTCLFNTFFSEPFILFSNVKKRLLSAEGNNRASENINFILHSHCDKWFVEQFMRFWDVNILKSLFAKYGSCIDIVKKIYGFERDSSIKMGLFESVLYDQYIYENIDSYKKYDMDCLLEENMSREVIQIYMKRFYDKFKGSCGISEHFAIFLDRFNIDSFVNIFKKMHIDILRVDDSNCENLHNESTFLKKMQPKILTCSQNHAYQGVHDLFKIYSSEQRKKIAKQWSIFIVPFPYVIKWILAPIKIIKYTLICLLKLIYIPVLLIRR